MNDVQKNCLVRLLAPVAMSSRWLMRTIVKSEPRKIEKAIFEVGVFVDVTQRTF